MKIFLLGTALLLVSISASCEGIDSLHQVCSSDRECQIIVKGCACIHNSTCMGPAEKAAGYIDGVNKSFAAQYRKLSSCSATELGQCSRAGACAMRGEWIPVCHTQKCTVVFRPKAK